jgi:hypothetical protein
VTLSREQIEQMPAGPELDMAVAEHVFGWTWMTIPEGRVLTPPDLVRYVERRSHQWIGRERKGERYFSPRQFSSDISAAWEVAMKFIASGCAAWIEGDGHTGYRAGCTTSAGRFECEGESPAHAMARAALLAVIQ